MNESKLKEQSDKLLRFHREISEFYNECAKSSGCTLATMEVLRIIQKKEQCTQKEIAQLTLFPKQTVNAITRTLIEQKIVETPKESEKDKRNKVIYLTEYGKEYSNNIISKVMHIELSALDRLGEEKVNSLIEIIEEYKNNLKKIEIN